MPFNIVVSSDTQYLEHLAVALCSLFENNRDLAFDVYVLNTNIDEGSWTKLLGLAKRYGQNLIDLKISDEELEGLVTTYHLTLATYYRLFIPEKLSLDKVLYLDADIVVNGSIKDLYNTDVSESYLAGVLCPGFDRHKELEMAEDAKYFNAGVMVINLKRWRQERLKERVIEIAKRKPEAMVYSDQCGINAIVNGCWKQVHPKYNLQGAFVEIELASLTGLFAPDELINAIDHPVIIHYTGSSKPWQFHRKHHPYRRLYWKYLRKTPYNHLLPRDLTIARIVRWCTRRMGSKP
jgi:lipopolysaccharide biosynthesis glycosyltransferase